MNDALRTGASRAASRRDFASMLLDAGDAETVAIVDDARSVTYAELRNEVEIVARELASLHAGLVPIPRGNTITAVIRYIGALRAGLIACALPPRTAANRDDVRLRLVRDNLEELVALDTALLLPTSGSMGRTNYVVVSRGNLVANTDAIIERLGLREGRATLCMMPLSYCFALSVLHTHLAVGGTTIISDARFGPRTIRELSERWPALGFAGVPPMFQALATAGFFRSYGARLGPLQQAGGPLSERTLTVILDETREKVPFFKMYGQTEATARISAFDVTQAAEKRGSVGRALTNVTASVQRSADGLETITVRGPSVTPATIAADGSIDTSRVTQGILDTGDIGSVDEDGYLYVAGRASAIVKVGGVRVSAESIEATLLRFPGVSEVIVFAIPDEIYGERLAAAFIATGEDGVDIRQFRRYARRELGPLLAPVRWVAVDSLPRTATGKVARWRVRDFVETGRTTAAAHETMSPNETVDYRVLAEGSGL